MRFSDSLAGMDSTSLIFKRRPIAAGHKREEKQIAEEEKERGQERKKEISSESRIISTRRPCRNYIDRRGEYVRSRSIGEDIYLPCLP